MRLPPIEFIMNHVNKSTTLRVLVSVTVYKVTKSDQFVYNFGSIDVIGVIITFLIPNELL